MELPGLLYGEVKKHVAPEVSNYGVRSALVAATAFVGEPVVVPALAFTKAVVEHVGIKLPFYFGKAIVRGCIEIHNKRTNAGITPNSPWCPDIGKWNFLPANRRHALMNNWFWDPTANGLRPRIADWSAHQAWLWKNLKYTRPEDRCRLLNEDGKFNPKYIEDFKYPQPERVYQAYKDYLSQKMSDLFATEVNTVLTPRKNAAGTHYVLRDGTFPELILNAAGAERPRPSAENRAHYPYIGRAYLLACINTCNDYINKGFFPAHNVALNRTNIERYMTNTLQAQSPDACQLVRDAGMKAARDAAAEYYDHPNARALLDPETRRETIEKMMERIANRVKMQHNRQYEGIKLLVQRRCVEEAEKMFKWCHVAAAFAKFGQSFMKETYGFDDLIISTIKIVD